MSQNQGKKEFVIIEIRAGTGGDEAGLFAADLFRMYSKYAQSKDWQLKILESRATSINGLKEIIFELSGENAFQQMRYEGGVHRVQRIPCTEKKGRIHTSTASVAVFQKSNFRETQIKPEHLKIETFCASGPGGQYTNKRETAVRATHKPTGITASCQTAKSQAQNKENAIALLGARILQKQRQEQMQQQTDERRSQIKGAKRAEKIRTYNFPQNRLTDHRIKKSWHNLERIMDGNLRVVLKKLAQGLQ